MVGSVAVLVVVAITGYLFVTNWSNNASNRSTPCKKK